MNVELLQRIKAAILEEPRRIDMDRWFRDVAFAADPPPCGTIGCIYGWGIALHFDLRDSAFLDYFQDLGVSGIDLIESLPALEIFDLTREQQQRLFLYFNPSGDKKGWPAQFLEKLYRLTPGTPEYARVVADRIDHFIATDGRE